MPEADGGRDTHREKLCRAIRDHKLETDIQHAHEKSPVRRLWIGCSFGVACIIGFGWTVAVAAVNDSSMGNMYVHQARAFLEGRLDIRERIYDACLYQDRYYVPFPPVPALLLVPYAALHQRPRATLVAALLTLISVDAFRRILRNLHVDRALTAWLMAAFFLGTTYWYTVTASWGVWFFAHVVSVTFMLTAIGEALGAGRGIRTGLFLACACLSRQLSVFSSVFLITCLWNNRNHRRTKARCLSVLGFMFSLALCIGAYLVFNRVRFGRCFDTGYSHVPLSGFLQARYEQYGLFHPAYFLFNIVYMFLQGPHLEFDGGLIPVRMDPFGTSLILASPFLLLSFFARHKTPLVRSAWMSIGLTLLPMLFYHNNGWSQVNGQRFSLDFLPVLMVVTALSVQEGRRGLFHILTAYSVTLNAIALLVLPILTWAF
jgi:hypothetical protein